MGETGGQFWKRVPELDALGIYGKKDGINIIDITENFNRTASYFLGEELKAAGFNTSGREALEAISFVFRDGNLPPMLLNRNTKSNLKLMSFSIGTTQFYGRMLAQAAKGDPNAIAAFLTFNAITAMQTGSRSVVPVPIDATLNAVSDEYKEAMQEFDKQVGFNLVGQLTGQDFAEFAQPLGGPAFGIGQQILTSDIQAAGRGVTRGVGALSEGEYLEALARFTQAYFAVGQFGKIPGVNNLSKRAADAAAEAVAKEHGLEEGLLDFGERTGLVNPLEN